MKHPNEGALRRMADEPTMVRETDRRHVVTCPQCRSRLVAMEADARQTANTLAAPQLHVDITAALAAVQQKYMAGEHSDPRWRRSGLRRISPLAGIAAALVALTGTVALTPVRSLAQSFITVFQPQQIQAVPVTSSELSALPDLRQYGTVHMGARTHFQTYSSRSALIAASGIHLQSPAPLPTGVPSRVEYRFMPGSSASFQFSAAKAAGAAASSGKKLPAMPASIDGSTLRVTVGDTVLAIYGAGQDIPSLVIGEMRAPRITSTGTGVQDLERYVLSLPGIPPQLANQLHSINDPATTLPLLIPVDKAHAHAVDVQGVHGLAVGDNTGLGSVVVWEKGTMMYGVGGTLSERDLLATANSLK